MRRARVRARAPCGCPAARGDSPAAVPGGRAGAPPARAPTRGPPATVCNAACIRGGGGGRRGRRRRRRRAGRRGAARATAGATARPSLGPIEQCPADDRLGTRARAAVAAEQRPAGERGGGRCGEKSQQSQRSEDYAIASHTSQPWGSFRRRATLCCSPCLARRFASQDTLLGVHRRNSAWLANRSGTAHKLANLQLMSSEKLCFWSVFSLNVHSHHENC